MSLAKAFVTGRIVKAPEKRFTPNDLAIAGFTINIDEQTQTLIRVVAFGQLAETISSTMNEGDMVAVDGKLQTNTFKLPNGNDKRVFEITASVVEKISGNSASKPSASNNNQDIVSFNQDEVSEDLIDEDEIPF